MLSAPWIFTNQTIAGTMRKPNGKSHKPVQPLMGGCCPSFLYIFPISEGITNAITGWRTIQITRPRTPPRPSPGVLPHLLLGLEDPVPAVEAERDDKHENPE